jgi:hemerythrin-like domain-containing protein
MKLDIPLSLQHDHQTLHDRLREATELRDEVGEAACAVAQLKYPHLVKEDRLALPPLALVAGLARGDAAIETADALELVDQFETELPKLLAEHRQIVAALHTLREAAASAGRDDIVALANALADHARIEEEVLYPTAQLIGAVLRQRLAQTVSTVGRARAVPVSRDRDADGLAQDTKV